MANVKMPEDDTADFISKKVDYMVQAIRGSLGDDAKSQFGKLSSDAERFAFLWDQTSTHDVIVLEPEFSGKSADKARTHREKVQNYTYVLVHHTYVACLLSIRWLELKTI